MNATELSQLSLTELKAICTSHAIEPVGDKRLKATWILAIETFQSEQTVIDTAPLINTPDHQPLESPLELVINSESIALPLDESVPLPAPQPQAPTQHRQASVVVLIPLILLSVAIIAIRIGIGTLIPLIAVVVRFTGDIWQSVPRTLDSGSIPIDYFPA